MHTSIRNYGSILLLLTAAACARDSAPASPSSPEPIVPATATPLKISTICGGPFRPGDYVPLACSVFVNEATSPASTGLRVVADLRAFGGAAESNIPECPACGPPPRVFDLDLHIPAGVTPGRKTVTVLATDVQGRRAETSATFEVIASEMGPQ